MPSSSRKTPTLGANLKKARNGKNWSITKLSTRSNVAVGTISELERDIRVPHTTTLLALARALSVSLKDLTGA